MAKMNLNKTLMGFMFLWIALFIAGFTLPVPEAVSMVLKWGAVAGAVLLAVANFG